MSEYNLSWITPQLAIGRAPMSYAELDFIRSQGINAIVNLCAEFSDLHELEKGSGFEVLYLPVWDDEAPGMDELESGLAWLDEAIYLGKKVLIHCRHGIGRTGTLVTSYLLRKGIGMKAAVKKLKPNHTAPTSISQRKLLKRYGKNTRTLTIREPSLEHSNAVNLTPYVDEYEILIKEVFDHLEAASKTGGDSFGCGIKNHRCCIDEPFNIQLIEAICLNRKMNKILASEVRTAVIDDAKKSCRDHTNRCPLHGEKGCLLYGFRPFRCLTCDVPQNLIDQHAVDTRLKNLSNAVFLALSGRFPEKTDLTFSIAETLSGKYVQEYFDEIARLIKKLKS